MVDSSDVNTRLACTEADVDIVPPQLIDIGES